MKKGSYWFSFLSEKEQKEFRENCIVEENNFNKYIDKEFQSFKEFMLNVFSWYCTPQCHEYWSRISNRNVQ